MATILDLCFDGNFVFRNCRYEYYTYAGHYWRYDSVKKEVRRYYKSTKFSPPKV